MKAESRKAKVLFDSGVKLLESGKLELALQAFRRAQKKDPKRAEIKSHVGIALLTLNRYQEALEVLEEAVETPEKDPELYLLLSNTYNLLDAPAMAIITLERALTNFPHDISLHERLGILQYDEGEFSKAYKHLQCALRLPNRFSRGQLAVVHHTMGKILYEWKLFKKALLHFQKAEELLPETYENLQYLGYTAYTLNERDEFRKTAKKIFAVFPENVEPATTMLQ